jgi:hypothetical protein
MFKTVTAKLANMRKPQNFVVTRDQHGHYMVQSDKSIGTFDGKGHGVLNTNGSYFMHLGSSLGARAYTFPGEFVQECQEIFMRPGEEIGINLTYGGTTTIGGDAFSLLKKYLLLQNAFVTHDQPVIEPDEDLWNLETRTYQPYNGGKLEDVWLRRCRIDFEKFLDKELAKEIEVTNGTD